MSAGPVTNEQPATTDLLRIGRHTFRSRLIAGTGKYRNADEMNAELEASGCEVVTVTLRRIEYRRHVKAKIRMILEVVE